MDTELNAIMSQLLGEMQQLNRTIGKTGTGGAAAADQATTQFGNLLNKGMSKVFERAGKVAEDEAKKAARAAERNAGPHRASDVKTAGDKAGAAAFSAHVGKINNASIALNQSLTNLGKSFVSIHKNIMAGDTGTSKYAEMTATAAQGALSVASAFGKLNPVVGLAAQALIKFAVAAAKQGDDQFKVYQKLQEAGASTADDLDGVNDMLTKFGLTAVEAEKVLGLIASTAPSLAMFRDNVGDGAKAMAKLSKNFEPLRGQLTELGISVEEQRAQMFSYMEAQAKIQGRGVKISNETTEAMAKYMLETNALTKLTGATRQQQEDAQRKALQREQLASRTRKARQSNDPAERAAAERDLQTYKTLTALANGNDEVANAVQSLASGMTTESGLALQRLTGGEAGQIAQNKDMTPAEQAEAISKAIGRALDKTGNLADAEAFKKAFGIDFAMLDSVTQRAEELVRRNQDVTADNAAQLAKQGGGVKSAVATQEADIKYKTNVENFVQYGVEPMMKGMSMVATGLSNLSNVLPGKTAKGSDKYGGAVNNTGNLTPLPAGTPSGTGTPGQRGSTNTTPSGPRLGAGPVFGSADMTWNNKVLLTLEETRDEIKKLVKMGAITTGSSSVQSSTQAALAAHDHAHPHGEAGGAVSPEVAAQISAGFVNPLKNMVQTSGMMRNDGKTFHGGIDLGGKIGDAIMAPITGKITRVLEAGKGDGGFGNAVEIEDSVTGMKHILAHMDKSMAVAGTIVKAGTQIGTLGSTGQSTGPHLHHEMRDASGKKVDPSQFYTGVKDTQGRPIAGAGSGLPRAPGGATDMSTYMRTVAMLESGGNPNVKAQANGKPSSAGGLFGFLESSWKGLGGTNAQDRFDPAKSTEMMAKFSAQQKTQMEKNLGRGVSGADLYMGHFLGAGGATKFLGAKDKDPTQSAARLDPAAAASNKSIFYNKEGGERSVEEVYQMMTEKYRKQEANVMSGNIPALVAGITGSGTLAPGGLAGPSGMPTPYAAAPGAAGQLPAAQGYGAAPAAPMAPPAGGFDPTMLAQLVAINREQNVLLGRILQTSQA